MRPRIAPNARTFRRPLRALQAGLFSLDSLNNRRSIILLRVTVLASSVALMVPGAWGHSVTVVEFAQLPAGLAAWQRQSLGIYRVCGPLSKFLYALPAYFSGIKIEHPSLFDSDVYSRPEWDLGRLFQIQYCESYHQIYRWSRLFPIAITVLGGCLICEWSTRLFGDWPGVVSLCVWCWMPPILAHGALVTSDVLSAVMLVLAGRCFWAFLLRPRPGIVVLAGLTLGLAISTKFTLLILYPCWFLLSIGRAFQFRFPKAEKPHIGPLSPPRLVAMTMLIFMISVLVINDMYLFDGFGASLAQLQPGRSSLVRNLGKLREQPQMAWLLWAPLPIPIEFLRGLDFQLANTEGLQSAYLLGRTRHGGWCYWYVVAFLIKVPMASLVVFGIALYRLRSMLRERDTMLWGILCLLLPALEAALAIAVTTGTGTNAAFRYLIPTLALLCVWSGSAWNRKSRTTQLIIAGLLFWLAMNASIAVPDHLGWQNEIGWAWDRWAGQPALIGDSLEWGQDAARLAKWVNHHHVAGDIAVCIYGLGTGEPYGLASEARRTSESERGPAYLAVSENVLFGYEIDRRLEVDDSDWPLEQHARDILRRLQPICKVGRTIRIYRISDLDQTEPYTMP